MKVYKACRYKIIRRRLAKVRARGEVGIGSNDAKNEGEFQHPIFPVVTSRVEEKRQFPQHSSPDAYIAKVPAAERRRRRGGALFQ